MNPLNDTKAKKPPADVVFEWKSNPKISSQ
jgi:hypothetical protein